MSPEFKKYAIKGNEFVKLVAGDLQIPRSKAGAVIRAVLHVLRDQISHEESFRLLARLPVVLKGVYVDGWNFEKKFSRLSSLDEFLENIKKEDMELADYDFSGNERTKYAVGSVLKAMSYYISAGDFDEIIAELPNDIKKFVRETLSGRKTTL